MKLPSVDYIQQKAVKTILRFPAAVIDAVFGTVTALILIDPSFYDDVTSHGFQKLIMTFLLGCPLLLSLTLFAERRKWESAPKLLLQLFGTILLAAYHFALPEKYFDYIAIHMIRFFLFNIGLYLMVMLAPYLMKEGEQGLWQYNWSLFLRLAATAVCTLALYAGFSFALWALDELFGVDIRGELYGQLFIVMAGIFAPVFFLAGVPENFEALNALHDYPKPLKVFTQYILIPLETLYLVILYLYAAKIIFTWNLPRGWVSSLILVFSLIGITSQILVFPLRGTDENPWIKKFTKLFYFLLAPLLVMLFLAIGTRIAQYGITESRYFVLLLSLWLTGVTVYFLLTRSGNIKIIPVSFCMLAFLSSFGPWGAFRVSEQSQIHRLESLLVKNNLLASGKIMPAKKFIPAGDAKEMRAALVYLEERHGFSGIQRWFEKNLTASCKDKYAPDCVTDMMNISAFVKGQKRFSVYSEMKNFYFVSGYDYLLRMPSRQKIKGEVSYSWKAGEANYSVKNAGTSMLAVTKNNQPLCKFDVAALIQTLMEKFPEKPGSTNNYYYYYHYDTPPEAMSMEAVRGNAKVKIYFNSITGTIKNGRTLVDYFEASLLVKK